MNKAKPGIKNSAVLILKGFAVGVATIIPGLSGGTAALLFNIYEQMLEAVAEFFKNIKKNLCFLLLIGIGTGAGLYAFSGLMSSFTEAYPTGSTITYAAITLASLIYFMATNIKGKPHWSDIIFLALGTIPAFAVALVTKGDPLDFSNNLLLLLPMGFFLAFALVLPAISFTSMMVFFGIYKQVTDAINNLDITFLLVLALGVLVGVLVCSKLFLWLIRNYPRRSYITIAGFVLYSVFEMLKEVYIAVF